MKILVYGHSLAHYRQRKMWEWIAEQGHKVDTIVLPAYQDEVYKPIQKGAFTQYLCAPVSVPEVPNMWYFPQLAEYILKLEPDMIFCYQEPWTYAAYYGLHLAKLFKKPFGFFTWENISKTFPQPWRKIEGTVIKDSDLAIAGNKDAVRILLQKGVDAVAHVLQTGLDPDLFFPEPRLQFDERIKPKKILFVGRLTEAKGIRTLLQAFDKLPREEFVLQFVGGRGELEGLIRSHPDFGKRITLEGWTDYERIPSFYNDADVSVMPSIDTSMWVEQCGYAVGESLLCHVPVLTSTSQSIMEIWKAPGVHFSSQGDVDALVSYFKSDIYKPTKKGRQFTIDHYGIETIGKQYIELLEGTING